MIWLVAVAAAVYVCCVIYTFRVVFRDLTDESRIDAAWFMFSVFMAVYFALIAGPIIVAWRLFIHMCRGVDFTALARSIGGESRADKITRFQREAQARERRIRDLERELDLA